MAKKLKTRSPSPVGSKNNFPCKTDSGEVLRQILAWNLSYPSQATTNTPRKHLLLLTRDHLHQLIPKNLASDENLPRIPLKSNILWFWQNSSLEI
jgi:hypothetical protein